MAGNQTWRAPLVVLLLACPAAARAQGECGDLDASGECAGQHARFCATDDEGRALPVALDCAALRLGAEQERVEGRCELLPDFGAWCVLPTDAPCGLVNEEGTEVYAFACDAAGLDQAGACDLVDGCQPFPERCTPETASGGRCVGDRLWLGCTGFGQAVTLHCAHPSVGGHCDEGACRVGAGYPCAEGSARQCSGGAACRVFEAGDVARCALPDGSAPPLPAWERRHRYPPWLTLRFACAHQKDGAALDGPRSDDAPRASFPAALGLPFGWLLWALARPQGSLRRRRAAARAPHTSPRSAPRR